MRVYYKSCLRKTKFLGLSLHETLEDIESIKKKISVIKVRQNVLLFKETVDGIHRKSLFLYVYFI